MMAEIILALNNESETLSSPEILVRDELLALGYEVRGVPWLQIDPGALGPHQTVVLRTVWDYSIKLPEFRRWVDELQQCNVHLINGADLIDWNVDKAYLLELSAAGFETPSTCAPTDAEDALRFLEASQSESFIIKPRIGGGGIDVFRLTKAEASATLKQRSEPFSDIIVQEYCPEVEEGEISFVFFYNDFSHAIRRVPSQGDFRANGSYGSKVAPYVPPDEAIDAARQIIGCAPSLPVFSRIDAFMRGSTLICSEFELLDPALFLKYDAGSAARFAQAIHVARHAKP